MSSSDPLLCQQKEKYSQTFDEAHISRVLSLIDERERWKEGKAESKRERERKENAQPAFCSVVSFPPPLQVAVLFKLAWYMGSSKNLKLNLKDNVSAAMFTFDKCQLKRRSWWDSKQATQPHSIRTISCAFKQTCSEHVLHLHTFNVGQQYLKHNGFCCKMPVR